MKKIQNINIRYLLYLSYITMIAIMVIFAILRSNQLTDVMVRYNHGLYSVNARRVWVDSIAEQSDEMLAVLSDLFHDALRDEIDQQRIDMGRSQWISYHAHMQQAFAGYRQAVAADVLVYGENLAIREEITTWLEDKHLSVLLPQADAFLLSLQNNDIDQSLEAMSAFLYANREFNAQITQLRYISRDFTHHLITNMSAYDAIDESQFTQLTVAGLTIAVLLSLFMTEVVSRPVRNLYKRIKDVDPYADIMISDDIRLGTNNEIGRLSEVIAELLEHAIHAQREVHLKAELEHALKRAEAASDAKSAFVANTTHELRTPMNSIMGFSQLALKEDIADNTRDYLTKIHTSARYLLNIINDILDFSKMEANKLEVDSIPFALDDVIEQCKLAIHNASESNILATIHVDPVEGWLIGDSTRLTQVCINLLSNALKFTEHGSVQFFVRVLGQNETSIRLQFQVVDTGIGMSEEQLERIQQAFIQADNSISRKYGGTGLGIPISQRLIELMGGELKVQSVQGQGSTFGFTLDFERTNDQSQFLSVPLSEQQLVFTDVRILIAEDNKLNQEILQKNLEQLNIASTIANNGKEAVDQLTASLDEYGKSTYDLVLMDVNMPVMDGIEATRLINARSNIAVIATTANANMFNQRPCEDLGMSGYLPKPFSQEQLLEILSIYVSKKCTKLNSPQPERPAQPVTPAPHNFNGDENKNDDSFMLKLQRDFLRNNARITQEITSGLVIGDLETVIRKVHDIKSNSGFLEQHKLSQAAGDLEQSLRNGTNHYDSLSTFVREFGLSKSRLERIIAEAES